METYTSDNLQAKKEAAWEILERMGRSCGAFALMMSNDGKRIELILERKSFGGGTRGERYLEVRFEGGILVNNRSVDLESTFSDLIELAMEEPLFRVVEPSRGLV